MRRHALYADWLRWLAANLSQRPAFWRGRAGILVAVLPPVVAVALVQYGLRTPLAGVLGAGFLFTALGGDYPKVGSVCAMVYALGIFAIWLVKETTDESEPVAAPSPAAAARASSPSA